MHIGDLREALRDGHVLLRALDRLAPGCVDWGRCHAPPFKPLHRHPRSVENCNQVRCYLSPHAPTIPVIPRKSIVYLSSDAPTILVIPR